MRERSITLPELALIAGTRGVLGVGIGLLVAGYLSDRQRKTLALPLILVGALSTIPIAVHVLRKPARVPTGRMPEPALV
jgi:hypothetical protein